MEASSVQTSWSFQSQSLKILLLKFLFKKSQEKPLHIKCFFFFFPVEKFYLWYQLYTKSEEIAQQYFLVLKYLFVKAFISSLHIPPVWRPLFDKIIAIN